MHAQSQRRALLLQALADSHDAQAVLVTDLVNVRYLCGFTGSSAALLVRRDGDPVLATDGRYLLQAAAQAPDVEVFQARRLALGLAQRAAADGVTRLAVESDALATSAYQSLVSAVEGLPLVLTSGLVEGVRAVKDDEEIEALRNACAITDAAFAAVVPRIRVGDTERDVAFALLTEIHRSGGEGLAFDSIVAFGENSAIPHHQPTGRESKSGDLVKVDFGARYAGYHADMTRTAVVGVAADWQRDLYDEVARIQRDCSTAVVPGAEPKALNALAAQRIRDGGHVVAHGLGHGVGLAIHEAPFLTAESMAPPLEMNQVVTVEPGIYVAGNGGVRIEDTVLVTRDGAEPLTRSARELIEI